MVSTTPYTPGGGFANDPANRDILGDEQERKRRRKKRQAARGLGGDPYQAPAGQNPSTYMPPQGQGVGRTMAPAGTTATPPSQLGASIADDALRAPAGSLASQFSGVIKNPEALETVAANPIMQADELLAGQYGLPTGSRSAAMLATYLDPQAKAEALGGAYPGNSIDWINFGEQLMTSPALQGNGVQLNPKTMMQTLVQTLMSEFNAGKSGASGSTGEGYTPLRALADQNPASAIPAFTSIVQGALQGTMPAEQLAGYVSWLKQEAFRFMSTWAKGDAAQMEGAGQNWLSALVQQLGPGLGL
jgi:hypothetical protein